MKLLIVRFAFWLEDIASWLRERFDICSYSGCTQVASDWCITGGHRMCYAHQSYFYSDVDFCQGNRPRGSRVRRARKTLDDLALAEHSEGIYDKIPDDFNPRAALKEME